MRLVLALCMVVTSCAATPIERPISFFDIPGSGFTIPAREVDGWSMERLVLEYGRATNQRFMFDPGTLAVLKETNVPLERELVVPPEAVHPVVEALLVEVGFMLMVQRPAEPRLVNVSYGRGNSLIDVPRVNHADLQEWGDHPAYMVATFIMLDACDSRLIANSLNPARSDSSLQVLLPLGTSGALLVQGPGPWVCEMTDMLLEVNEAARLRSANLDLPKEEPHVSTASGGTSPDTAGVESPEKTPKKKRRRPKGRRTRDHQDG